MLALVGTCWLAADDGNCVDVLLVLTYMIHVQIYAYRYVYMYIYVKKASRKDTQRDEWMFPWVC